MLIPSASRILKTTGWLTSAIIGLSLLAMFTVQPASANTYQFTMPVSALQIALDNALGGSVDPSNYGFYNLYIRPRLATDPADTPPGGNVIDFSSTEVGGVAPITSPTDGWYSAVTTSGPPLCSSAHPCFYFTYNSTDTTLALVTPGTVFNGKTLPTLPNALVGEQMPTTDTFAMNINSPTPITIGSSIRFEFSAQAYLNVPGSGIDSKVQNLSGFIDVNATKQLPEPVAALTGGFGCLLLVWAGMRRVRKTS